MARGKNVKRGAGAKVKTEKVEVESVADTKVELVTPSKENGQNSAEAKGTPAGKKGRKPFRFRKKAGASKKAAAEPLKEFAGLIFMCNTETKKDCFKHHVFGLPEAKKDIVERAKKGIKLFLFDIDQKVLYGVYRASSVGGLNLVSEAFQSSERKFPAQIRFRIHKDCAPLDEDEFKPAIKENYFGRNKFKCELSSEQVGKLIQLFRPLDSQGLPKPKSGKDTKGEVGQKVRTGSTGNSRGGRAGPRPGPARFPRPPVWESVPNYSFVPSHPSSYSGYAPSLEVPRLDTDALYRSRIDALDRRAYVDPVYDASLRLSSDLSRRRLTEDLYSADRSLPPSKGSLLYEDLYRDLPYQRDPLYSSRSSLDTLPYKSSLPLDYSWR